MTAEASATPTLLQQAAEATRIAKDAFSRGHDAFGIAGTVLAAELTQLAKTWGHTE